MPDPECRAANRAYGARRADPETFARPEAGNDRLAATAQHLKFDVLQIVQPVDAGTHQLGMGVGRHGQHRTALAPQRHKAVAAGADRRAFGQGHAARCWLPVDRHRAGKGLDPEIDGPIGEQVARQADDRAHRDAPRIGDAVGLHDRAMACGRCQIIAGQREGRFIRLQPVLDEVVILCGSGRCHQQARCHDRSRDCATTVPDGNSIDHGTSSFPAKTIAAKGHRQSQNIRQPAPRRLPRLPEALRGFRTAAPSCLAGSWCAPSLAFAAP